MKTKWYRKSGIKGLLVLLTVFFMVAACAGAGASVLIMSKGVQPLDSKDYVDSQSFTDNVYNLSHTIVDAINERHILDQADDEELIDLKELNQGDTLTHKSTSGLAYRAGDLYDWAKSPSWDTSTDVLICRQPDGSDYYMYYRDFADKIATGELKFVFGSDEDEGTENTKDILSMLSGREYTYYGYESDNIGIRNNGVEYVTDADGNVAYTDVYNYESSGNNDAPLKEVYKPDGADSILDVVNNNKEWKGNLSKAYQYLYEALVQYSDASYGEKILKTYASGATNVNYMYVDTKSGKVYTNIKDVTSSNYLKTLDKLTSGAGPFMLIAPDTQDCVLGFSNISDWTVSYWQNMLKNTGLAGENYLYFVSVDKDFPVLDRIKQEKLVYDKFEPWLVPVMAGSVLALILALAGVVILTIGAGRNNEDKKVHLNFFDRCYTEIVAVVVFMIWLMGTSVIVQAMDDEEMRIVWKTIGFGTLGLWFGIWFLAGWLSLVRRIKARSLWRDSLLRHILLLVRKCFSKCSNLLVFLGGNMISRVKIILLFGIFIFLQFMFTGMTVEGGSALSLLLMIVMDCAVLYYLIKKAWGREQIIAGLKKITDGDLQYKIPTEKLSGEQEMVADYINHIGEGLDAAVENSLKNERMKTELITNVSHDIKTPLTSIINYVDLLKRENPEDPKIRGYLEVLENKAQRLKVLTEDVVEASKASTGNIALEMTDLNFIELVHQVIGEFEEKFEERNLTMVVHFDEEEAIICADGRRLWRVLENVFGNVSKYAMENTRVYVDVKVDRPNVQLSLKNISAQPLNISAEELTERFIRGDVSRNTEGSGLGLSIAKDLVQLQGGEFKLYLDGDLFKVTIEFRMK
ncbi:sensor histidine kinase [Blautia obeum]|jgi:signal transduction histidine kinase|uniref:sensor histidine kinase n=1 Tax=Blautia obeum TaxID=40520 RepID=UPI00156EBF74|nr:HAMP domain-containing sensor histidine kinase [Blautia obeum]NSG06337.1 HAMP domain-containing histidine kinase [Blautia obeum]NSG27687.1 HAMP domain-containing histidine kinase [Blautia obeum]